MCMCLLISFWILALEEGIVWQSFSWYCMFSGTWVLCSAIGRNLSIRNRIGWASVLLDQEMCYLLLYFTCFLFQFLLKRPLWSVFLLLSWWTHAPSEEAELGQSKVWVKRTQGLSLVPCGCTIVSDHFPWVFVSKNSHATENFDYMNLWLALLAQDYQPWFLGWIRQGGPHRLVRVVAFKYIFIEDVCVGTWDQEESLWQIWLLFLNVLLLLPQLVRDNWRRKSLPVLSTGWN